MASLFRRVLVPHDLSDHATRALQMAVGLAREHRGRLQVLHVVTPFYPVADFPGPEGVLLLPPSDLIGRVRARLESIVRRTVGRRLGSRVDCRVVIGDPIERILAAARRADSIVMATAGRRGLSHLLLGSVAEKVVRSATVPVLTIRPAGRRRR